nr:antibiotic biosynthesis monooxygenase [Microbacterium sp. ZXX196]
MSRSETGCVRFLVEPTADPLVWSVSERFVDRASFEAHQERVRRSAWGRATQGIPRDYVIEFAPERSAT